MTTNDNIQELIDSISERVDKATEGFSDQMIATTLLTKFLFINGEMNRSKSKTKEIVNKCIDNYYGEED